MKTSMSYRYAVVGLAVLTLISVVSCGKKSKSATIATPPATTTTTGECTDGKCTLGNSYASGLFMAYAVGQNDYGYDKNITAKVSFFGTEKSGY